MWYVPIDQLFSEFPTQNSLWTFCTETILTKPFITPPYLQGCIRTACNETLSYSSQGYQWNENLCFFCVSLCRWWVGDWQKCSASCGSLGLAKRIVLCIQAVSADRQKALDPSNCEHLPKPESTSACNTDTPCQADWVTGSWSKVSFQCL